LLKDNEAEVRIAAAGKVAKFCGIVTPQQALSTILPCVKVRESRRYRLPVVKPLRSESPFNVRSEFHGLKSYVLLSDCFSVIFLLS
jgi:hypothetical protein